MLPMWAHAKKTEVLQLCVANKYRSMIHVEFVCNFPCMHTDHSSKSMRGIYEYSVVRKEFIMPRHKKISLYILTIVFES